MKIDLREVPVMWISLDSATENHKAMEEMFKEHGFKNTTRFSALKIPPHKEADPTIRHYRGCAESHIHCMRRLKKQGVPFLILEDDAKITEDFVPEIEVEPGVDAVYLGISHGNQNYEARYLNNGFSKIEGVFATHAILWTSKGAVEFCEKVSRHFIWNLNTPFDIACANEVQKKYNVITPLKPFFYQADERDSSNKWENLTKEPLNTKKKSVIHTIGY